MLLENFYKDLKLHVNKDGTDDYFGIDDFNRRIGPEQLSLIRDVIKEERDNPSDRRSMTDYLRKTVTITGTYYITVPTDLLKLDFGIYQPVTGAYKTAKVVSLDEINAIQDDILAPPIEENYVLFTNPLYGQVHFRPAQTTGSYVVYYIRKPTAPFLDYYIDANREDQFLPVGVNVYYYTGTYRLGTTIPIGGTLTSSTVELGIPEEYHDRLMDRMIERLSIKDRDSLIMQHSMAKDQENFNKN
jgi:hypothetical protein